MKHIRKNQEPEQFSRWKKGKKGANWKAFARTSEHRDLRASLLTEQLGMCCYCEAIIALESSHLEHLKPKSVYPKDELDYRNLLASCNQKKSCGGIKDNWYDPEMVSPLAENCEKRFTYNFENGEIIPFDKDDLKASETIEKLGLNFKDLKDQRRNILKILDNNGYGSDPKDLKKIIQDTLEQEKAWPFGFYTVLIFLAEKYKIPGLQ